MAEGAKQGVEQMKSVHGHLANGGKNQQNDRTGRRSLQLALVVLPFFLEPIVRRPIKLFPSAHFLPCRLSQPRICVAVSREICSYCCTCFRSSRAYENVNVKGCRGCFELLGSVVVVQRAWRWPRL